MNKNVFFALILAAAAVFGLPVTACNNGTGGTADDTPSKPKIINGYYGVTSDGKSIELTITPASKSLNNMRSVNWSASNTYSIKVNGAIVSQGIVTNINGAIVFYPSDGSWLAPTINNDGIITSLNVTDIRGNSYSGGMIEARDYYYCIGAATDYTFNEIKTIVAEKTPEQVYTYCLQHTANFFDPQNYAGTFAEVSAWGQAQGRDCPDSEVQKITNELNTGSISGIGFYPHAYQGQPHYVMFYISRIPLQ